MLSLRVSPALVGTHTPNQRSTVSVEGISAVPYTLSERRK